MAKYIFLILILILSTMWLWLLHFFAPTSSDDIAIKGQLKFPGTLEELKELAKCLKKYSVNHWWYVLLIFGSAYIYKQAFCIPGSIFLNMLSGALYGKIGGLFFACLFTATGAILCYHLSNIFAKDLVFNYFLKRFENFQQKIKENNDNLFFFMLFIRLVPVTPGWVINIVAPLVGVSPFIFFITTFLGLGPYNFVGVSAGEILSSLQSLDDVFTWSVFFSILGLALVAGGPAYVLKSKYNLENKNKNFANR